MTRTAQGQWGAQFNLKRASPVTTYIPFLWQAGGEVYAPNGRTCVFNSPQGVRALEFMVGLFKKGYVQQANITGGGEPFTAGRMGALIQAEPNDYPVIRQQAPGLRIAIGPTLKDARQVNFGTVGSYAMFARSKNKDAALKWILHITEPRNMVYILKATNAIAPRKSMRAEEYATTPEYRRIVEEVKHARPEPVSFFAREVLTAMMPELEAAFLGVKTPKQALDAAVAACDQLLKQPRQ
jgi:multiple sugar transport system substrate-binding protein